MNYMLQGGKRKGQGKRDTVTGISSSGEDIGSDKESCEFIDAGFLTDKEVSLGY